jgi:hypothetical protein
MIRLSPSTLGLYKECPRCFWLQINEKFARPRGIFPTLPGGMDLVIKKYYDSYRGKLPPELEGKIDGILMDDLALLNKWRNWRTGLEYYDKERDATLFGALDDCLVKSSQKSAISNKKLYMPLDYKTQGFPPQEGASEIYYQHKLDAYALMLSENGYKSGDCAYLVYYYPREVKENGTVDFEVKPVKINTDIERIRKMFEGAVDLLNSDVPAGHSSGSNGSFSCEFGLWHKLATEFD